jgi:hypothetical protein
MYLGTYLLFRFSSTINDMNVAIIDYITFLSMM